MRQLRPCPKCKGTMLQSKKISSRIECGVCGWAQPLKESGQQSDQAWFTSKVIK